MAGQVDPDGICFVCGTTFVAAIERDHAVDWKVHFQAPFSDVVIAETCSPSCAEAYSAEHPSV